MQKISIEYTVVEAYKFLFRNIASIVGVMWFPVLVFLAIVAGFAAVIVPHEWLHGDFVAVDPDSFFQAHLWQILLAIPCLVLAGIVLGAMIRVGVLQLAMEEKPRLTLFWFSLGARVWRMIVVGIIAVAVVIAIESVAAAAFVAMNLGLEALSRVPLLLMVVCNVILALAVMVAAGYFMIRLFFFLPAVVVAENKVGLARAWRLGAGNVLRIIVVWLAVTLPISMIGGIVLDAILLPTFFLHLVHIHPGNPMANHEMLKVMAEVWPAILVVELLIAVAITGTTLGAIGKAYGSIANKTA